MTNVIQEKDEHILDLKGQIDDDKKQINQLLQHNQPPFCIRFLYDLSIS
ncbi:hypothetical protein K1I99_05490 [Streptococcus gordonii]|nr:hypothetical protein [Streptococcus gordonii]MBZ2131523.1 hypothetical protein [Streptococcus gordonii]